MAAKKTEKTVKKEAIKKTEIKKRALTIAITSLKYTMLKQDTNKPIVFDPREAIKFEGNTGPYLLYTYARAKSILRKSKPKNKKLQIPELSKTEKSLITHLNLFPETVERAYKNLAPNIIANFSYELAQKFNEFYHSNKVIGSEEEQFRLALVQAFAQVLKNSLNLLGIETLESM